MYAWVTLVMLGDNYVPGALVVGQSLIDVKTQHKLICMVTHDVSDNARKALGRIYQLIEVPYLTHPTRLAQNSEAQRAQYSWVKHSFTKWRCLGLEFAKIIFVDADMVFVRNCDNLFKLKPPAASFTSAWARPWKPTGMFNPYLRSGQPPKHGDVILPRTIFKALNSRQQTFVAQAGLVLLKPDIKDLDNLTNLICKNAEYGGTFKLGSSGPDEAAICEYYAKINVSWTNIGQEYLTIPWKPQYSPLADAFVLHFMQKKPWKMNPNEYPDLVSWWQKVKNLCLVYPELIAWFPVSEAKSKELAGGDSLGADVSINVSVISATGSDLGADVVITVEKVGGSEIKKAGVGLKEIHGELENNHGETKNIKNIKIYIEYAEYTLSMALLQLLTTSLPAAPGREVRACLERWLISVAQTMPDLLEWPIYRQIVDSAITTKLADELRQLVINKSGVQPAVSEMLKTINTHMSRRITPDMSVNETDISLIYSTNLFEVTKNARIRKLLDLSSPEHTLALCMRYAALLPGGQQWGVPYSHYTHIHKKWNVQNEAFASALNSRAIDFNGNFCSLFPDLETVYGSLGSFFKLKKFPDGNWFVNPPFVEKILTDAVDFVEAAIESKQINMVFFVVPAWHDAEAVIKLKKSKFKLAEIQLSKFGHIYENTDGDAIIAKFNSLYFALAATKPASSDDLYVDMRTGWMPNHDKRPPKHNLSVNHLKQLTRA